MFGWLRRAPDPSTEQQLQLKQALVGYPPYTPPDWNPDPSVESMRAASFQYRDHFLGSRPERLEALRAFLAKFDVALDTDDAGLMAVSAWLPNWADLLVEDFDNHEVREAYDRFIAPWIGELSGLNVIFDLGIYYAECVWCRRTKLEWIVVRGHDFHGNLMASHLIKGLPLGGKLFDPIETMYSLCRNIRVVKVNSRKRWVTHYDNPWNLRSEAFSRHVLAKAPPGRRSRKREQR